MISLILTLLVIGAIWFGINQLPFIDGTMKLMINIIIFICVIVWIGHVFFGAHVMGLR